MVTDLSKFAEFLSNIASVSSWGSEGLYVFGISLDGLVWFKFLFGPIIELFDRRRLTPCPIISILWFNLSISNLLVSDRFRSRSGIEQASPSLTLTLLAIWLFLESHSTKTFIKLTDSFLAAGVSLIWLCDRFFLMLLSLCTNGVCDLI